MNPEGNPQEPQQRNPEEESGLTEALESTLDNLNESIRRMEEIARKLEDGEADLDESIRLLSEANELASTSSRVLDKAFHEVVYGSGDEDGDGQTEEEPEN